jgi:hypothetical protein
MDSPPNFVLPVPSKANAQLSANKKMTKENQIKTSHSLTKKKDKMVLLNIEGRGLLKYKNV